jgi:ABC-2 type transport system permease protein
MDNRKLFAVIRREFLERVRSKWFLIGTLFGPLLFGALLVIPSLLTSKEKDGAGASRIIILDATGAGLGARIAGELAGGMSASGASAPTVEVVANEAALVAAESLATRHVIADSVKGYLVIDQSTLRTGAARYAGSNTTAIFDMQRLERSVQRELLVSRIAASGIDPEVGRTLAGTKATVTAERLSRRGRGGSGQVNFVVGLSVAMLIYVVTFIYGLNVLRGVLEEKQTRVAEVVISSISAPRLLIGKVIGIGGVGLTQVLIWMGTSVSLWKLRAPLLARFGVDAAPFNMPEVTAGMLALLVAFFLLGFLFYAGLFAIAGAVVNSEQEAQQAQMPIVLLLVSCIILAQNILMQPDSLLARIVSVLPHSASIIMPLRMTVAPVPTSELVAALLSVTVGAIGTLWLAGRVYRTGLLMYGKRPTVREMLRWVRQR